MSQTQQPSQENEIQFKIIKGSPTQYSITSKLNEIDICITNYSDDKTMMICLTDCGCFRKWVQTTRTTSEIRFGLSANVDPFPTSMGRLLIAHLDGVDKLLLGVGIKEPSREKLLMIVEHIKIVMVKAIIALKEEQKQSQQQHDDDDFDDI